ncbi:MAG: response regulator transcription factor [Candidatus Limnocylindria bacterium]
MTKILIVDDDLDLVDLLSYALRRQGYAVVTALDGEQALARWREDRPDLVLLDVNLPRLGGFEVCRQIRRDGVTPIIMLTARDEDGDIVNGLRIGADDYVVKPFSATQLAARIRAVLRRTLQDRERQPATELRSGDLVLDLESHQAVRGGQAIQLTALEFRILYMLVMNEGRVIPYSRLIEYTWGYDGGDSGLLKTHISHLRDKLQLRSPDRGIRAVAGVGYSLALA